VMRATGQPLLPMSREEMARLGWDELDVLLVSGDAYADHPSFGAALLGRWLMRHGYRVGIVAQPRWDSPRDLEAMGRPRLFAGVTAGAIDSMLAHYTAFRKKRSDDAYTPGGKSGARPNHATIVYTGLVRAAFPGLPVVIGGIEASLRRVTHYDFWSDKLRRSILLDSKADLLVYGMGERAVVEIARRLEKSHGGKTLHGIPGTVYAVGEGADLPEGAVELPSHEDVVTDARKLMDLTLAVERLVQQGDRWAVQRTGNRHLVIAPPAPPLSTEELDAVYALPFTRAAHPSYNEPVPALEMIQFSITSHRGCGGGCSFCSLALHQGRRIGSRSRLGILEEARQFARHPQWKGSITDVGGPSANMWGARCTADPGTCRRPSCLYPRRCPSFVVDQDMLAELLEAVSRVPGVKHVRVASGLRHDLAMDTPEYVRAVLGRFTGGQLKLAPEHSSSAVLCLMRKPPFDAFLRFLTVFERESARAGKQQYVVPYLMSAFPGCTDNDMRDLAAWLRGKGWKPQQVQCFIPTPGTVAAAMYYAGTDPQGKPIHVAKTDADRIRQHRILLGSGKSAGAAKPRTTPRRRKTT